MSVSFSVLQLEISPERWETVLDKLQTQRGTYIYFASEYENPDPERIRKMFRYAPGAADMIIPAMPSEFPNEEALEENPLLPLPVAFERYRCPPLVNGKLIKKEFLIKYLKSNLHDWIHSPCPDLFLMFFASAKVCMARTDYIVDRETFLRFVEQFRNAFAWLAKMPDQNGNKYLYRSRMLQYEDYLIDQSDKLNFSGMEKLRLFNPLSVIHNAVAVNPEKLPEIKLTQKEKRCGPVRSLAVFCTELRTGGAERCASLLLNFFASLPNLKICLFMSKEPKPGDYPCPETVEKYVLPRHFYDRYSRLPDLLQERQVDTCLFFDHFMENFYYDLLAAREMGIRTIAMEHNTFAFPLYSGDISLMPLRRIVYAGTDIVTCLSRSDEYIWNSLGIRARYMPNPLTFDTSARPQFKERENKNLIFIARMIPGKGVLDALKTVEILRQKHPDVKLFMLGCFPDPDFEQETHAFIRQHQLEKNIVFTGFTTQVDKYINQSSVHLMPSCVEGYPMTLMEVKSYGLPTISYSLPYLEAGKEEYGTIMVPRGDYRAMAEKVSELLDDFKLLNNLSKKAYDSLQYFDNQLVFSRWKALFLWLETGSEPAELALPSMTAEEKQDLLQIQTHEIIFAADSISFPSCKNRILNCELSSKSRSCVLFGFFLKMYFAMHQKIENGSLRGLVLLFRCFWMLKRIYRLFKPWQDKEQKL